MRTKLTRLDSVLLAVAIALLVAPAQAAKTCSEAVVSARGEPASYLWLAKTKARANWRRKVRATPSLGAEFASWGNAETSEERCITAEGGTVCIFTGYPCKR